MYKTKPKTEASLMNFLLERIIELLEVAERNEEKGLYYHALEKYNLVTELFLNAGQITLSADEQGEMMRIREFLLEHLPELRSKIQNGQGRGTTGSEVLATAEDAMFDNMDVLLFELKRGTEEPKSKKDWDPRG